MDKFYQLSRCIKYIFFYWYTNFSISSIYCIKIPFSLLFKISKILGLDSPLSFYLFEMLFVYIYIQSFNWFMSSILELKPSNINSSIVNSSTSYEPINYKSSQKQYNKPNNTHNFDNDQQSQRKYEIEKKKINKMVIAALQEVYKNETMSRFEMINKIQNAIKNLETQKLFLKQSFLKEDKLNNLKSRLNRYQTEKITIYENIAIWLAIVNNPQQNSYPKKELDNLINLQYWLQKQYNFEGDQYFSNFFLLDNVRTSIQSFKIKQQQIYIIECEACELLNKVCSETIQFKKLQLLMLAKEKYQICYQFDPFSNAGINYNQINLMIDELMKKKCYLESEIRRGRENLRNPFDKPVTLQVLKQYKQFFGDFY